MSRAETEMEPGHIEGWLGFEIEMVIRWYNSNIFRSMERPLLCCKM